MNYTSLRVFEILSEISTQIIKILLEFYRENQGITL